MTRYVIIGDSIAGNSAAARIHALDPKSPITILSAEQDPYYSRCALMYYAMDHCSRRDIQIADPAHYRRLNATVIRERAVGVDTIGHTVKLEGGDTVEYDKLLIVAALVIMPVLVYYYGKRVYCSWLCGCGCLAETLGDPFRRLTPRSRLSRAVEPVIYLFVLAAVGVTVYALMTPQEQMERVYAATGQYDLVVKYHPNDQRGGFWDGITVLKGYLKAME